MNPGNPTVNFRGEPRRNVTHRSTTDPESVLYRKANGQASKLCFGTQVLMENRHGLCAAPTVHDPIAKDEPPVALAQVDEHRKLHEASIKDFLGADKAYHQRGVVAGCRQRAIPPPPPARLDGTFRDRMPVRPVVRDTKPANVCASGWKKSLAG